LLLSREYFQLVQKRLKPGGVFAIYSNSMGNADQSLLVRETVASVFPYYESFKKGYLLVASNEPITYQVSALEKLAASDPLAQQILAQGIEAMQSLHDQPRLQWKANPYVVTDNHPMLEYPNVVSRVFQRWRETHPPGSLLSTGQEK
jgi:hypothetical protein